MGSGIQEEKVSGQRWVTIAERERPGLAETIGVTLYENGSLNFHGQDLGDIVGGDDNEYEYGVTVPASEIGNLVLLLLKEKYDGDFESVEKFKRFCKANEIANQFWYG